MCASTMPASHDRKRPGWLGDQRLPTRPQGDRAEPEGERGRVVSGGGVRKCAACSQKEPPCVPAKPQSFGNCMLASTRPIPVLKPSITVSEKKFTVAPAPNQPGHAGRAPPTRRAVQAARAPKRAGSPPASDPEGGTDSSEIAEVTVIAVCREPLNIQNSRARRRAARRAPPGRAGRRATRHRSQTESGTRRGSPPPSGRSGSQPRSYRAEPAECREEGGGGGHRHRDRWRSGTNLRPERATPCRHRPASRERGGSVIFYAANLLVRDQGSGSVRGRLSRACAPRRARRMYQGECGVSVAFSMASRAREYAYRLPARGQVYRAELPLPQRVLDPGQEAALLLLVALPPAST